MTALLVGGTLAAALPSTAAADLFAPLTYPSPVATYRGITVWSAFDPTKGTFSLRTERNGKISRLGVPRARQPFDVSVGPGPSGEIAVFARCAQADARWVVGVLNPGRACRLYRYDFRHGTTRRLSLRLNGTVSTVSPSVWRSRLAFVARQSDGTERLAIANLATGAVELGDVVSTEANAATRLTGLALRGTTIATTWRLKGGTTTVMLGPIGGAGKEIDEETLAAPGTFSSPSLSDGFVTYALLNPPVDTGSQAGFDPISSTIRRYVEADGHRVVMAPTGTVVTGLAVDGATVAYGTSPRPEFSGCGKSSCRVLREKGHFSPVPSR